MGRDREVPYFGMECVNFKSYQSLFVPWCTSEVPEILNLRKYIQIYALWFDSTEPFLSILLSDIDSVRRGFYLILIGLLHRRKCSLYITLVNSIDFYFRLTVAKYHLSQDIVVEFTKHKNLHWSACNIDHLLCYFISWVFSNLND